MSDAGEVRAAACRLLVRREHSRLELARKLRQRGFAEELIEAALIALASERLLSEDRFTESYIRYRAGRGYGPQRIRAELAERGVEAGLIDVALRQSDYDWIALARDARERRFGEDRPADIKERARQQRFLYYRGFDSEQIRYAFNGEDD